MALILISDALQIEGREPFAGKLDTHEFVVPDWFIMFLCTE
jgi:hypothetical protein